MLFKFVPISLALTAIPILYSGCAPSPMTLAKQTPETLILMEDSLLTKSPDDPALKEALVMAHLSLAATSTDPEKTYKSVLKLDPRNPKARYELSMAEGFRQLKKNYKNAQWEALVSFGKAATAVDTLGAPHYWMAKCYEKKDNMDFDLALESYDKALTLSLPDTLRSRVEEDRAALLKRKNTFESFWK